MFSPFFQQAAFAAVCNNRKYQFVLIKVKCVSEFYSNLLIANLPKIQIKENQSFYIQRPAVNSNRLFQLCRQKIGHYSHNDGRRTKAAIILSCRKTRAATKTTEFIKFFHWIVINLRFCMKFSKEPKSTQSILMILPRYVELPLVKAKKGHFYLNKGAIILL